MKSLAFLCAGILFFTGLGYSQSQNTPYVILVSFDGFRFDYVEKFNLPNFKAFIKKGTKADGLIPSFPSKTFPNHYSIVTGLFPGHHGLVDNSFYDPERGEFYGMRNRKRVTDPYYYGGTPLWVLARQHGLKSASFFWVGSELPLPNLSPDYHFPYDETIADTTRIQQVLRWLQLPENERPHLITLYFSSPDHEAHLYGPSSEETRKAVLRNDEVLGMLTAYLQKIPLPVNVILVSDHGMEELKVEPQTYIFLDEILNRKDTSVKVSNGGTQAHVYVDNVIARDSIYELLKANGKNYAVYKQDDFPEHWYYRHPRAGDLLITANPGFSLVDEERKKFLARTPPSRVFGVHGYDPKAVANMKGIFYAMGPNIKQGKTIPPFQNVHIYPLIAKILDLPIPKIDGDIKILENIIAR